MSPSTRRRRKLKNLAPDMGGVLIYQSLGGITEEKLGDNEKSDILLAIESLLKDVAAVAVGGKINDTTSISLSASGIWTDDECDFHLMQLTIFLLSSAVEAASRHRWTAQFPKLKCIETRGNRKCAYNQLTGEPSSQIHERI